MTDLEVRMHGEKLKRMITELVETDILTLEDMSKIIDICINAAKRKEAEITEDCLAELIRNGTPGADQSSAE